MKSNSQNFQDLFVLSCFEKQGFFLEIGANDGITFSNSYLLEKKGWDGICIEADPLFYSKLVTNRKCNCINAAVTSLNISSVDFLQISGYHQMLSGILNFHTEKQIESIEKLIKKDGGDKKIISVDTLNLSSLNINQIDYLSIDIEGGEYDVLSSIDFNAIKIKVISVENSDPIKLSELLNKNNFLRVIKLGGDQIWIHNTMNNDKNFKFPKKIDIYKFIILDLGNRIFQKLKRISKIFLSQLL